MSRSYGRGVNRVASVLALGLFILAPIGGTIIAASPASAQDSIVTLRGDPAAEAVEREKLFAALAVAANASEARVLVSRIWSLWFRAPNTEAARAMEEALTHRQARDYVRCVEVLDSLIETEPGWAEAWNQRATIRYLLRDLDGSLADIDRVLEIEPKHFGALSGQAMILMHQGKMEAGQLVLRKAVEIDPFLSERALLMEPTGQDI